MSQLATKPRLSPIAVLQIYAARPARNVRDKTFIPCRTHTRDIAEHFEICERSVRDIWNRRAWREITRPAWSLEEVVFDASAKTRDPAIVPAQPHQPAPSTAAPGSILNQPISAEQAVLLDVQAPLLSSSSSSTFAHVSSTANRNVQQGQLCALPLPTFPQYVPPTWAHQCGNDEDSDVWVEDDDEDVEVRTEGPDPFSDDWIKAVAWARSMARRHAEEEEEERHTAAEERGSAGLGKRRRGCVV